MVYCGKASQGCQSCRTRRIKCDKVQPQCTQCVRIRKQCPGYRDQLSLMFRDESTKVMQKAHAQWGVSESSEAGESSTPSPSSPSSPSSTRSRWSASEGATPRSASLVPKSRRSSEGKRLAKEICASPVDKAIQFYIEHFVIGLPDEPKDGQELHGMKWVHSRETQDIMVAVGLAGLSNLTGDKETNTLAKHHYGLALQNIASSVQNIAALDLDVILRAVVMMAMYEVTRPRNDEPASPARTHVMGGAAILTSVLPHKQAPADGPRGLLQMCFSMLASKQGSFQYSSLEPNVLIPTQVTPNIERVLPESFFGWVSIIDKMVSDRDRPSAELIKTVTRFVQLSAVLRSQPLVDGQPKTTILIREALEINQNLESWERRQDGTWAIVEEHVADLFPAEAVFEGCYHVYDNTYIARVWNHYRWTRIMVNQMLLESIDRFPASSTPLVSVEQQRSSLECIRRLARDTLVSVPTHYRHPSLQPSHREYFDKTKRGAGIGIAGIPTLLFEVKVAACAPGVLDSYRTWALGILETAYRDTGMFQANALAGFLRKMIEKGPSSPSAVSEERRPGGLLPRAEPGGEVKTAA